MSAPFSSKGPVRAATLTPGGDAVKLNRELIENAENDQVARNWLVSANPRLDGITAAELVRNDNFPAVFRAADAFVTDTYYS